MNNIIKASACSTRITVADPQKNAENIIKAIKEANEKKCDILVLPELCICGYSCSDLFFAKTLINASYDALITILQATADCSVISLVGLPLIVSNVLCNASVLIQKGSILSVYVKDCNGSDFRRYFPYTPSLDTVTISGKTVPVNVYSEDTGISLNRFENKVVLLPSAVQASYLHDGTEKAVSLSLKTRSCVISAGASCTESTQDVVYNGKCIIAQNGIVLNENNGFDDESIISADVDLSMQKQSNVSTAVISDREKNPFLPSYIDFNTACERILQIQAYSLKKRIEHTYSKTAVIGISGGLDSTLSLLATVRAFDLMGKSRKDILCVTMPCFGTTSRTKSNAVSLCEMLEVDIREINIKNAVLQHFNDIGHDANVTDITYENSQARERTQVLMDIANRYNGLVIGTGDMSELALGWATYNGDHMSMYSLNASITKTMVRNVVKYEASRLGGDVGTILNDILDTPVSPELLPADNGSIAQKTEDLVGPYELHDFFLYHYLKHGSTPTEIFNMAKDVFASDYDEATIKKWLKIFFRRFVISQFKRSCVPDGPCVGELSLSPRTSLKMPSDASYAVFINEIDKL